MKMFGPQLLLAILVLVPVSVAAETIYLKDGSTVTGKITKVGTREIVVTTVIGEMTIESEKISRIDQTEVTSAAISYPDSHLRQKNGLGFGLAITGTPGIIWFYDHNLSGGSQMHVQLGLNAMARSNQLGETVLKTQRSMISTTYRYFPGENSGFYMGAGIGYADSKLKYNSSPTFSAPYEYTSKANGVFALGEVGWQGKEGYYFHVGLQPAAYLSSSDDFDISRIPNISNHRSVADQEHNHLKQLTQISVGFGWFF